jgi:hypothetical protein
MALRDVSTKEADTLLDAVGGMLSQVIGPQPTD